MPRPDPSPRLGLSIVIDDEHLAQTEAIAGLLRAQGLDVGRVVPEAGAIYATGDAADMDRARRVEGVIEVTPEPSVQLPPLDGRVPQ